MADINTLWRRKPFEALSQELPVLGLAPRSIFAAWIRRGAVDRQNTPEGYRECSVTLPPGWASRFPGWTAKRLWARANQAARSAGRALSALVVTSPHYLPLVERAQRHVPTFYYCSDDYAHYAGWGGKAILQQEAAVVRTVAHSFFVSEMLAERAVRDYGAPSGSVSVSPNATDEVFLKPVPAEQIQALLAKFPRLRRPLVGVVGGINERLDFDLLLACAGLPEVGTLVMVGSVADGLLDPALGRLNAHPRCLFVGAQPHTELPKWMQMLDVALIPYRDTPLNRSCSPMRLFDHLAAGQPILATDACPQVVEYRNVLEVATTADEFVRKLSARLRAGTTTPEVAARREIAQANLWSTRAQLLAERLVTPRL